jgi:hypothetical protein
VIAGKLTELAQKAADRYLNVIHAMRGIYAQAVNSSNPFKEGVRRQMMRQAQDLTATYFGLEVEQIQAVLAEIALTAVRDARFALGLSLIGSELSKPMTAHLRDIETALREDLTRQLQRDAGALQSKLKTMLLQANMQYMAGGGRRLNHLASLLAKDDGELKFWFVDRANRRWPSQKFVRSIWRQALVTAYNEIYLMVLADAGERQAVITGPNSENQFVGKIIAIAADAEGETYLSLKEEAFHPNSELTVARISKS